MISVLVDGVAVVGEEVGLSVADGALLRGDGCFEVLRAYRGRPFLAGAHLRRLQQSADRLELELPARNSIATWVEQVSAAGGDCLVRVVCSRGAVIPGSRAPGRCLVLSHPLPPAPTEVRLGVVPAPWHPAGRAWELTGVKSLSYAANLAAGRVAQGRGFDDALLVSSGGRAVLALEGPTFSVGWVIEGRLEFPSLDTSVLDSVTRRAACRLANEAGIEVVTGPFPLSRLEEATEVLALSTVKEVVPVVAVEDWSYPAGEVTKALGAAYRSATTDPTFAI